MLLLVSTHVLPQHLSPFVQSESDVQEALSVWHVLEQPSPSIVLPSSHCSPVSMVPSPQAFSQI
jgi:hypothetical protein